jgi:hypothetical protein
MNNNEQESQESLTKKPDDKTLNLLDLPLNTQQQQQQQPLSAPPQHTPSPFFHHNKRTSSSSNVYPNRPNNNNNNNNNNRQFHRAQTEHVNLNHYKQPAPFQPAAYHHNTNLIIDKYNRKYNLISFILLRKYDNFINEEKIYLNDQLLYNLIKNFIQNFDHTSIINLFKQNKTLPNHKNSYNSSLFIYTIREALDFVSTSEKKSETFLPNLFNFLFENELPDDVCNLNDGDYPMRNIMHYSARYNSTLIQQLLFKHVKIEDIEKLCLLTDYNGNTPLHIAVQHDAPDFIQYLYENLSTLFKQINFDYAYNYDGFNLVQLACRSSSLKVIKYLHETVGLSVNLKELNQSSLKTCLHLAILRTVDQDVTYLNTFKVIKYLYEKNNYLAYELSPLVGSVFHIAASNLTRLHLFWYFVTEYNEKNDKSNINDTNLSVNSVDFREYSCIDCFIDTLINIRAIIPATETVYSFYKKFFYKHDIDERQEHFESEANFELLIKKCLFKLIAKCKAKITRLPQIKTQVELLEFIKLLKFMSKFHFKLQTKFDSIYYTKFEAFCLKFLNTFIFTGDLLPVFNTNFEADQNNNNLPTTTTTNQPLNEIFLTIFSELIELTRIIISSGFFTKKFQQKIYSFMCDYFSNLNQQYEKFAVNSIMYDTKLEPKLLQKFVKELSAMNRKNFSLKDLCRYKINFCLFNSTNSSTSNNFKQDAIYFSLPINNNIEIVNFLTFNLIKDLGLADKLIENDEIFMFI